MRRDRGTSGQAAEKYSLPVKTAETERVPPSASSEDISPTREKKKKEKKKKRRRDSKQSSGSSSASENPDEVARWYKISESLSSVLFCDPKLRPKK